MKTIMKNISLLLCVVVTLTSCYRKPLYDECICVTTLSIPIDVDWETSEVDPQNVTVLLYDSESGDLYYEHFYEHNDNDIQSYVSLPEGSYTAVVFNELRDQIDYVSCKDHQTISTLKFESNDDTPLRSRTLTRSYVEQPGDLAVAIVEGIVVTEDMILEAADYSALDDDSDTKALSDATRATVESLMGVVTYKKTATLDITLHVQNLFYARMPALVDLVNLADGYYVFGDSNSTTTSTLQFNMNSRTYYEDSTLDGTISATVTTFGSLEDRSSTASHDDTTPIVFDILFQLVDTDYTEYSDSVDVTDLIVFTEQANGSILMTLELELPDALPEVVPDGSEESAFGSSVEEWDDVVDISLR